MKGTLIIDAHTANEDTVILYYDDEFEITQDGGLEDFLFEQLPMFAWRLDDGDDDADSDYVQYVYNIGRRNNGYVLASFNA